MDELQALNALSAMANDTRLQIVRLLVPLGKNGLAAGKIACELGISASGLSFHLSALEQAHLISSTKCARQIIYRANHPKLGAVIGYLLNDCCSAHPEICACSHSSPSP